MVYIYRRDDGTIRNDLFKIKEYRISNIIVVATGYTHRVCLNTQYGHVTAIGKILREGRPHTHHLHGLAVKLLTKCIITISGASYTDVRVHQ